MSNLEPKQMNQSQIDLIKSTVARAASDDELRLFLYRANNLGLDPLKPGQIYFVKYGGNPGTIIVGIDGFRALAARTGKVKGIKRGALRDANGTCIGAWCEVYREGWVEPAREEVLLSEYNTGKSLWAKMPETMIKKVAEVAALRMAFPDELGGVYTSEEMEKSVGPIGDFGPPKEVKGIDFAEEPKFEQHSQQQVKMSLPPISPDITLQCYKIPFPPWTGKTISEIGIETCLSKIKEYEERSKSENKKLSAPILKFKEMVGLAVQQGMT